jgi:hypothetical protein
MTNKERKLMSNYIEARQPSAKGMRVISIKRVPMNLIVSNKDTHDNKARFKGLSNVKVSEYAALIVNGNYCPEYYIPPVVVKEGNKYRLIAGGHRHQGHVEAGATHFYCAVVEFYDYEEKSAAYWERTYQGTENKRDEYEVAKNNRTTEDTVSVIVSMVVENIIGDDEESIKAAIEDQGYGRKSDTGKNIFFAVMHKIGNSLGVPRILTANEAKIEALQLEDPNTKVIARLMKDNSGKDADYDKRLITKIVNEMGYHDQNIQALIHFTAMSAEEILLARGVKRGLLEREFNTYVKPFYDYWTSGEMNKRVSLGFFQQLEKDCVVH